MATYKRTIVYLTLVSICANLLGACASADRPSLLQTPTTARPKPTPGRGSLPKGLYAGITDIGNFTGTGELKSEGAGGSAANNTFAGTITVTVIEILSNGNLVVAGEKQVAISNEEEIIRFGGIVNPNNLVFNRISSQEVADARIEYRGRGATDDTQGTGWFTRLLLKMAPF